MKDKILVLLFVFLSFVMYSQENDAKIVKQIFDNSLTSKAAYDQLEYLCTYTPGRLLGTENSLKALDYMKLYFEVLGVDRVYLQEFTTPAWHHDSSSAFLVSPNGITLKLHADALGPSPSTTPEGLIAEVIEVQSLKEVEALGVAGISGKIVFYNRKWNPTFVRTFSGYGDAVDQRGKGPAKAAEYGAVGVLVRSVTNSIDNFPHTGSTRYGDKKIPAVAISTIDADLLSATLKNEPNTMVKMYVSAKDIPETTTYNLIAEIKGYEKPEEIIVIGAHIDAWFNTAGAHDDGAGCVMASDVLRLFKQLNVKNKHTIRVVLFMDEELYQSGGEAYAKYVNDSKEKHLLALETDGGAFTPRMFTIDASDSIVNHIADFQTILAPYGIDQIIAGWGGVDIRPLKDFGVPLMSYGTDSQRYFDLHHSANDTFDKINLRELQLGCGCITSIIYLIDKYGLD